VKLRRIDELRSVRHHVKMEWVCVPTLDRCFIASTILLIAAVGCDSGSPAVPSVGHAVPRGRPVTLSGRVLNFATGVGLSGATLGFTGADAALPPEATMVTDASGSYKVALPELGVHYALVDGVQVGLLRVTGSDDRGDLLARPGSCVARYGTVADGLTLRPVAGATVSLGTKVVTAEDGWYRIDLGCPTNGIIGSGTTFMYVSHPNYLQQSEVVGRGVAGVQRRDVWLQPSSHHVR
jgi:hypothetical protein